MQKDFTRRGMGRLGTMHDYPHSSAQWSGQRSDWKVIQSVGREMEAVMYNIAMLIMVMAFDYTPYWNR
jgi:hypothetical protein